MDKDTFWNYVNPLQERLFRFAFSILKNTEEAQDALHDVLEKLWYKRKKLQLEKNIDAFAMKVMKNHCMDTLRKQKRILQKNKMDHAFIYDPNYEQKDLIEILKNRLGLLPLQQKLLVELKDFQGYGYEEISEIMGFYKNV